MLAGGEKGSGSGRGKEVGEGEGGKGREGKGGRSSLPTYSVCVCQSHTLCRPLNFKKNSIVRYPNRAELGPVSSCPCEFLGRLWPGRGLLLVLIAVVRVLHTP